MAAPCNPWHDYLTACCATAGQAVLDRPRGYLTRVTGLVMEAVGLRLPVGGGAWVTLPDGRRIGYGYDQDSCFDRLTFQGREVLRLLRDRMGRDLPVWQGCRIIRDGAKWRNLQ